MYDFITIGAGAAGLFLNTFLPKNSSKLLIEKNKILGVKVLMSGGERANLSNIDIDPQKDYFSCTKKASISFLKRWTNLDTISFFESNGVKTKIEDRGRVITASGHARDIVKVLHKKVIENQTEIQLNTEVFDILKLEKGYLVKTNNGEFLTKNVIISVGGKSYPQVGTVGFGYKIAEKYGLEIISQYKGLCGVVTKQDLSLFSGTTIKANVKLFYNDNLVYEEFGPLLFTHWGVSGPCIFNLVVALGHYTRCKLKSDKNNYDNFLISIKFDLEQTTKKLRKYLKLSEKNEFLKLKINNLRSWKEAKVTGGGVKVDDLTKYLESKTNSGLFFIGEVVDITGKTGGFNLQWAWSSAYCCAEKFIKI